MSVTVFIFSPKNLILVDQNGYKKGVYSEKKLGHFQLFYFSKTLMYASVDKL
jgi:hypothetical protein